jgi:NAD(P)H dehydrogenase (quinone)
METDMSIVITGASGQLGRGVVEKTLENGVDPKQLILVTRTPKSLDEYAARGAQVRYGDFDDPSTLADAFAGGRRLLLISATELSARVGQHQAAIDAAVEAGVELIAYTSVLNPVAENPTGVVPDHKATEEALRESGTGWTFLRNSIYSDLEAGNLAAAEASGKLVTNAGEGAISYVARRDCAAAAAAVLAGGDHAGKAYDITGPEALDADRRAAVFAELLGSPVDVVQLDDDSFAAGVAEAADYPIEVGRLFASVGKASREGYLDAVSDDLRELTGREPESLFSVLQKQRAGATV